MTGQSRSDVYARVTDTILAAIEAGAGKWQMPWHHCGSDLSRPVNVLSLKPYRGINVLSLWAAAHLRHYSTGIWGTFRQWQELGAAVRKGEKASSAVLWKEIRSRSESEADEEDDRLLLFARGFALFNADQVDGFSPEPSQVLPESERLETADRFIAALGMETLFGSSSAHYRIDEDRIHMPDFAHFRDAHGFYATHIHECAHATGATHRLNRDFAAKWTDHSLAMEEMTAELAASFVLADLGLAHERRSDHAAYVASWLRLLKDGRRAIFTAASKAQRAADWMHAQQAPR